MNPETLDTARLADTLELLRQEVARLGERVAALEGSRQEAPPGQHQLTTTANPPAGPGLPTQDKIEELDEEIILVISAAVAAFLGKKPHIRQIRLLGSGAWAQAGRVIIQASHAL